MTLLNINLNNGIMNIADNRWNLCWLSHSRCYHEEL